MSSATPSRSKYANEEERKAAARERQRLYAARKRAEAKEAKLRQADESAVAADTTVADVASVESSPTKAKRAPKKVAIKATAINAAPPTPRKRAGRRKKDETVSFVAVNGDNTYHHDDETVEDVKVEDDIGADVDITSYPSSLSLSFSEGLTASDFLPPQYLDTDHLLIPPQPSPTSQLHSLLTPVQPYAIYHLPGNPGLVSYYTHFLNSLSHNLSNTSLPSSAQFTVFGASLGGFNASSKPKFPNGYCTLESQVTRQIEIITHLLTFNPSLKIIITGHSLGAYLLLSVLQHFSHDPSLAPLKKRIIGGIGLFPALTHLSKSAAGRRLTPFINIPLITPFLLFLANVFVAIIPSVVFTWLIKIFMPAFELPARDATLQFLKSPLGIKQAVYLGRDELLNIRDDVWDESVWGVEGGDSNTEMVFYFGEKDHWVFDGEREKLITTRGRGGVVWVEKMEVGRRSEVLIEKKEGWKPRMVVCEEGVRHSFCVSTHFSDLIAAKTAKWVEDIVVDERTKAP
ncbi:hypothetical protein ABW20_dc0105138 [Dactylellina cionopaga]|nr:hypothetical protein ABW20_dc0105138 [Dactylellina cionopaga]